MRFAFVKKKERKRKIQRVATMKKTFFLGRKKSHFKFEFDPICCKRLLTFPDNTTARHPSHSLMDNNKRFKLSLVSLQPGKHSF